MLKNVGTEDGDFTHQDNIKYNVNYSTDNDIKPAFPLPVTEGEQTDFPTRTHRSAKNDTTSFIDNYRIFLANQFKDLPKNRGELWKLSTFNNLLYFHMEESLYAAKGKQQLQMKDGSESFVGSGDIFQQDPDEIMQTEGGYGGTQSQYAALTTRYGYFFVDQNSKKIFLMKDKLSEISSIGMENWFQENMPFVLSEFGLNPADNPIESFGYHSVYDPENKRIILTKREIIPTTGFTDRVDGTMAPSKLTTDPSDKGTNAFIQNPFGISNILYVNGSFYYAESLSVSSSNCGGGFPIPGGCHAWGPWIKIPYTDTDYFEKGGWTISYYPELNIWGSFHDYIPYHYFNTSTNFYSLVDKYPRPAWTGYSTPIENHVGTTIGNIGIWRHNHTEEDTAYHPGEGYGVLYQENREFKYTDEAWLTSIDYHPFEFEFIHNEYKGETSLLASIQYTLEVFNQNNISVLEHGFTSYFLYNSFQASGESILEYLINTRYIGNSWKINNFRDMAAAVDQTGNTTTGLNIPNTSSYYTSTNPNVIGGLNIGTLTTSTINDMFIYNGMFKTINPLYLDLNKSWDQKRKFMDKWVGIRLIYDNITNNLLNLYSTSTSTRKAFR